MGYASQRISQEPKPCNVQSINTLHSWSTENNHNQYELIDLAPVLVTGATVLAGPLLSVQSLRVRLPSHSMAQIGLAQYIQSLSLLALCQYYLNGLVAYGLSRVRTHWLNITKAQNLALRQQNSSYLALTAIQACEVTGRNLLQKHKPTDQSMTGNHFNV